MKLLIGNTGLIGKTLKDEIKFDYEFNSKNIHELLNLEIESSTTDLYLCCLPATKWLVNKDPQLDLNNILSILNIITKKEYNNIILYSTIDVYGGVPLKSDESYSLEISTPGYGSNRLLFEKLISNTLKYKKLLILRLPALFGKHIKKNIIFDLLNNNQIDKINYNSQYQWYNLNDLIKDTIYCLKTYQTKINIINLFTEPLHTSEILQLFNLDGSEVNTNLELIEYNFKTNSNPHGYVRNKNQILQELKEFILNYKLGTTKIAVCLFGEPRDIVNRISDWKKFSNNFEVHFYLAFYSNEHIDEIVNLLKKQLPVKSHFITDNDLNYFNKLKHKAIKPINIFTADYKAIFPRITSQCYIRQKATQLVEMNDYDVILLCRSDVSNFNISNSDILNVIKSKDLLIVNSGTHTHVGGGGGCVKCTIESKCDLEFHANDICDWWCMGSPDVMSIWNTFYDNLLKNYHDIQKSTPNPPPSNQLQYKSNLDENEILVSLPTNNWNLIENEIHCFYPEKIMRSSFKDVKILSATIDKQIWLK